MVMFASLSAGLGSIWSGFVPDVRLGETDTSLYCPMFPLLATMLLIPAATTISVVLMAKMSTERLAVKFAAPGAKIDDSPVRAKSFLVFPIIPSRNLSAQIINQLW